MTTLLGESEATVAAQASRTTAPRWGALKVPSEVITSMEYTGRQLWPALN
jgi:hypothetical protein